MAFKVVVSQKEVTHQIEVEDGKALNGLAIGDEFDGGIVGFHPKADGVKRRKTVRGNTIADDIVQVNTVVVSAGNKAIADILGVGDEEEE